VSRQKLHKWLGRHNSEGMKGLVDRSRAPLHIPHRTSDEVAAQIIAFRRRFPHMGPRKIVGADLVQRRERRTGSTSGRRSSMAEHRLVSRRTYAERFLRRDSMLGIAAIADLRNALTASED
jgi:Homeodomain-like domain